jgi:hypothetical protein
MLMTLWFRCHKCHRNNFLVWDGECLEDPPPTTPLRCRCEHISGEVVPRYTFNGGTKDGILLVVWYGLALEAP